MECGSCRFCCWIFNASDIPDPILGIAQKPSLEHCVYECNGGCSIHGMSKYPQPCGDFECPYLQGQEIHRPDNFQETLETMNIQVGNFIPAVPIDVPVRIAETLIKDNRSIPAFVMVGREWVRVILSLDRRSDSLWIVNEKSVELWKELFSLYESDMELDVEPGCVMISGV